MRKNFRNMFVRESNTGAMFGVGVLAAVLGAGLTYYLYATESGTRKRNKLLKAKKILKDHAMEMKDDIKDSIAEDDDDDTDDEEE